MKIPEANDPWQLERHQGRLALVKRDCRPITRIVIDFNAPEFRAKRKRPIARSEPLARAVSWSGQPLNILDATAGFGGDAWLFLCMGCQVEAWERDPIVYALLEDALSRAHEVSELAAWLNSRLELHHGDARNRLRAAVAGAAGSPDVIYIDPMFPPTLKTAKSRKQIDYLQNHLSYDPDDVDDLWQVAISTGLRVVVKRPLGAPPLGDRPVRQEIRGKLVRYDVY